MKEDLIDIYYHSKDVGIRTYKIKYTAEVTHKGLNDYKVFTAFDKDILENKVQSHVAKLEERWERNVEKQNVVSYQVASQKEAEIKTQEAIQALKVVDNILVYTLNIDDTIDWEKLKDKTAFKEPNPENKLNEHLNALIEPQKPTLECYPAKPTELDFEKPTELDFEPKLSFFDKLIKSNRDKKIQQSKESFEAAMLKWNESFEAAMLKWNDDCLQIDKQNELRKKNYEQEMVDFEAATDRVRKQVADAVNIWQKRKANFESNQENKNKKVDGLKTEYMSGDQSAVLEYCELVLNNSQYPDSFPKSFELDYNPDNKILII